MEQSSSPAVLSLIPGGKVHVWFSSRVTIHGQSKGRCIIFASYHYYLFILGPDLRLLGNWKHTFEWNDWLKSEKLNSMDPSWGLSVLRAMNPVQPFHCIYILILSFPVRLAVSSGFLTETFYFFPLTCMLRGLLFLSSLILWRNLTIFYDETEQYFMTKPNNILWRNLTIFYDET